MTDSDFLNKIEQVIIDWHNCTIKKDEAVEKLKEINEKYFGKQLKLFNIK